MLNPGRCCTRAIVFAGAENGVGINNDKVDSGQGGKVPRQGVHEGESWLPGQRTGRNQTGLAHGKTGRTMTIMNSKSRFSYIKTIYGVVIESFRC